MRIAINALVALSLTSVLAACGSIQTTGKSKKSSSTDQAAGAAGGLGGAMSVQDEAALPACDATKEGYLVYVTSTANFRTCVKGAWNVIDLKGAKGDKGDKGDDSASGELTKALQLYTTYKTSIYRVTTECVPKTPYPAGCPLAQGATTPDNPTVFLGSSFLCGDGQICTNKHVAACAPSVCFTFGKLSLQAVEGTSDSINPDGSPSPAFYSTTDATKIKLHPNGKDLAKITGVTGTPASAKALPLTDKLAKGSIVDFTPTLAISYPLGFQDLYTDVGHVNTPYIGECDVTSANQPEGGVSGYGCPAEDYAFSTSNDTDHGSSGSPLFDINTGKVIGVTSAGTDGENANYTWAVDAFLFKDIQ